MAKLSKDEAETLVRAVMDSLSGKFYEPWEYDEEGALPKGFTSWREEGAVDAYFAELHARAVESVLAALSNDGR